MQNITLKVSELTKSPVVIFRTGISLLFRQIILHQGNNMEGFASSKQTEIRWKLQERLIRLQSKFLLDILEKGVYSFHKAI